MTYLELCQSLAFELGVAGANQPDTTPSSTTGQTGQLGSVVKWVALATLDIDNIWRDWKYLSTGYTETLTAGSRVFPAHSGSETIRQWDRDGVFLDYATDSPVKLSYIPWNKFRAAYDIGAHSNTGQPKYFSIKNDGTVVLDISADKAYTITGEFWKKPVLITGDNTVPDIPENYHRIIVAGAAIKYGNKEAAAEVIDGMIGEYEVGLIQLQSDQAPGFEPFGMSADDQFLQMDIPHGGDWD